MLSKDLTKCKAPAHQAQHTLAHIACMRLCTHQASVEDTRLCGSATETGGVPGEAALPGWLATVASLATALPMVALVPPSPAALPVAGRAGGASATAACIAAASSSLSMDSRLMGGLMGGRVGQEASTDSQPGDTLAMAGTYGGR